MGLAKGSRIGPYEIVGSLGAGGMGEVYRARDSKLNRDVAIKVLPESFAHDPDRLARFEREAQVLAALNHPNIAHIHGLESSSGAGALVMELVEGDDLSELIARGPIPFAEALPIAKQIADALEAAHELGIIHRDLKPANIKVRADGTVKVLDFGLAKALDPASASSAEAMNSPTLTVRGTQMGLIIGTAAYMSPEQARGKAVDRRADIWAFGVVFYEMLTGQRAFKGEDISITLASVLKDELDWQALPPDVPEPVRRLLRRCLERDPKRRLRDIGEARLTLEDPLSLQSTATDRGHCSAREHPILAPRVTDRGDRRHRRRHGRHPVVGHTAAAGSRPRHAIPDPDARGSGLRGSPRGPLPSHRTGPASPTSRTGNYICGRWPTSKRRSMAGTDVDPVSPFFSPDGQWIGFNSVTTGTVQKIPIAGGTPLTLCKGMTGAADWDGDYIVFVATGGIMRVPANGGEPEVVVKLASTELAAGPQILDGGKLVLFTLAAVAGPARWEAAQIVVQSMASGERHVVAGGGSAARYVPTGLRSPARGQRDDGHLVYAVGNSLMAVPFDFRRLETRGAPVVVVDQVSRGIGGTGIAHYAVSASGMLVYLAGGTDDNAPRRIGFANRDGKIQPADLPSQQYVHPRLSPDGSQLAVGTDDVRGADVWVYDLKARGSLRRLTFAGRNQFPIWTPDGRFLTFQSDRDGDRAIFSQPADGSGPAERLTKPETGVAHEPESWSPDGKTLSINLIRNGEQSVWAIAIGPDAKPQAVVDSAVVEKHSSFSPDGRWLAYMATGVSGQQVFVQPFPPTGAKYQISANGGRTPVWSRDGKELFFHAPGTNRLSVVEIRADKGVTAGVPMALPIEDTIHPIQQRNFDVTADGQRLVVVLPAQPSSGSAGGGSLQLNVVLNWFEELAQRVPFRQ